MTHLCLACTHRWEGRGGATPRQCPGCWSRSIASLEEVRRGRLFLRPFAYWLRGQLPPLPAPQEIPLLLGAPLSYSAVMGRARNPTERQRAAEAMLEEDGFPTEEASQLARRLFPEV